MDWTWFIDNVKMCLLIGPPPSRHGSRNELKLCKFRLKICHCWFLDFFSLLMWGKPSNLLRLIVTFPTSTFFLLRLCVLTKMNSSVLMSWPSEFPCLIFCGRLELLVPYNPYKLVIRKHDSLASSSAACVSFTLLCTFLGKHLLVWWSFCTALKTPAPPKASINQIHYQ